MCIVESPSVFTAASMYIIVEGGAEYHGPPLQYLIEDCHIQEEIAGLV